MQIQHLTQSVYNYINTHLSVAVGYQCYMTFYLVEQLGLKDYDASFVDLVAIDDGVEPDTLRDIFLEKVLRLAVQCIEEHKIKLNPECECTLGEVTELLHFLELVQRLEDYEPIAMRLHGLGTAKAIFADIASQLSGLEVWKILEMVESVHDDLIEAMKRLVKDTRVVATVPPDHAYRLGVKALKEFVSDTPCLGVTLYEQGYQNLTWETLTALITVDLDEIFKQTLQQSVAQCALDFVSLTLVCRDTYQTPSLHLQKVLPLYFENTEDVTRVYTAVMAILVDYQTTKEALIQQLQHA